VYRRRPLIYHLLATHSVCLPNVTHRLYWLDPLTGANHDL